MSEESVKWWKKFVWDNSLLIGEFIVIAIAKLNPQLGTL